jgi:hypothetical protein
MANKLYDKGREAFLKGDIDWLGDTIKVVLVDQADYTVDLANHAYLSSVPVAARVATGTLSGKTATNGIADANDVTFASVSGDECEALVLYKDTGVEGTSPLIAYLDTGIGLPVTPNGDDITIQWGDATNKIFRL